MNLLKLDTNYKPKINCEPKPKEVSQNKINIVICKAV